MEDMRNIVVLKDLPSNLVEEAIIVLKQNQKIKKIENKYKTLKRINIGLSIILFISLLFNLI